MALPDDIAADPASPIPARTERRTDTTRPGTLPTSGPEDLSGPEARLPHERDEATDMTGGARHPEIEQAFEDLEHGLQDTDRGAPAHNAYQKQKDAGADVEPEATVPTGTAP